MTLEDDGRAVISNCDLGFGIRVEELANGRASISVDLNPIGSGYDGEALRAFMEETAVAWLQAVAPNRLNLGSGY